MLLTLGDIETRSNEHTHSVQVSTSANPGFGLTEQSLSLSRPCFISAVYCQSATSPAAVYCLCYISVSCLCYSLLLLSLLHACLPYLLHLCLGAVTVSDISVCCLLSDCSLSFVSLLPLPLSLLSLLTWANRAGCWSHKCWLGQTEPKCLFTASRQEFNRR